MGRGTNFYKFQLVSTIFFHDCREYSSLVIDVGIKCQFIVEVNRVSVYTYFFCHACTESVIISDVSIIEATGNDLPFRLATEENLFRLLHVRKNAKMQVAYTERAGNILNILNVQERYFVYNNTVIYYIIRAWSTPSRARPLTVSPPKRNVIDSDIYAAAAWAKGFSGTH